jgi:Zn-dependent M28 family amino/carboxypeptidase
MARVRKQYEFRKALDSLLVEEGAVGIVEVSSRDYGILRVLNGGFATDATPRKIPAVTMMSEQYDRIVRLLEKDHPVRLRLDIDARFHDNSGQARNVVAEIPGRGRKDELVIAGAHLDSYQAGVGAVDNAAGCAVMMEAVRIIQTLGLQPERTIRICLWSGEEQGLLGSKGYVTQHFAGRPACTDSAQLTLPPILREKTGPIEYKKAWNKVSAYFNLDNGSGKIRGIYAEENSAIAPIFAGWLEPFADLGAAHVTLNPTWGTDHQSFDRVGLPGFQFIQDELNYMPQLHHTHLDDYDQLQKADLEQASVIVAAFLLQAADRDEMLPRKPKPREEAE